MQDITFVNAITGDERIFHMRHPQLLGCILVKAAKQCQWGSHLRFSHFLADLVYAGLSCNVVARPSSTSFDPFCGEPGAALPQPYVEMTFQSYVVML